MINGYVTFSPEDISTLLMRVNNIHNKIEFILTKHHLFNRKYNPDYLSMELSTELIKVIGVSSKYDDACVIEFNNRLTKFIISVINSIRTANRLSIPIKDISIEVELLEYISFLLSINE